MGVSLSKKPSPQGLPPRQLSYLEEILESGPSGCLHSAPLTGSHQGAAATCQSRWEEKHKLQTRNEIINLYKKHLHKQYDHFSKSFVKIIIQYAR